MSIEFNIFGEDPKRHVKLTGESFEEIAGLFLDFQRWDAETFFSGAKWDSAAEEALFAADDVPFEEAPPQPVRAVSAPSQAATQAARKQATADVPNCVYCGGPVWDNRDSKRSEKAPDFKCRNNDCKADGEHVTAGWMNKDGGIKWNTGI